MNKPTADFLTFGDDWVYCNQHLRPHPTGWCSVDVRDKLGLGIPQDEYSERARQAYKKCKLFGLPIYGDDKK